MVNAKITQPKNINLVRGSRLCIKVLRGRYFQVTSIKGYRPRLAATAAKAIIKIGKRTTITTALPIKAGVK